MSCGLCLNDCPTYRVLGDESDSPRGRIQLIKTLLASDEKPGATLVGHLDACLVCRACETACPSLVPFGRIMEGAREEIAARSARGPASWIRAALVDLVTHRRLMNAFALLGTLYVRTGLAAAMRRILPARLRSMSSLLAAREGAAFAPAGDRSADVQLFAGCVQSALFGDTQRATCELLRRGGHRVGSPQGQECCGALHAHAGLGDRARELARENVRAFRDTTGPIVVTAAGCGAHLRAYGHVLARDPFEKDAREFASRVRDASEVVTPTDAGGRAPRRVRVVYQDACHLAHGQGIRRQPRDLLRAIDGVELVAIADPERCCGSAGVYNLTHPDVARELQRAKLNAILAAHPDAVVSANPGCILQIRAGLREAGSDIPVVHLMRSLKDPAALLSRGS